MEQLRTLQSVFLTWTTRNANMRHFWVLFNEYFRPSDTQSIYYTEYYQKLTEKEVQKYLRPALKRTVETVQESYNFAMRLLHDSDQKVHKGYVQPSSPTAFLTLIPSCRIQEVFASDVFKTDCMPKVKSHLKADDLPRLIRLYVDTVCNNAAIVQEVIEDWDSQ
jgi:hypothetical protein